MNVEEAKKKYEKACKDWVSISDENMSVIYSKISQAVENRDRIVLIDLKEMELDGKFHVLENILAKKDGYSVRCGKEKFHDDYNVLIVSGWAKD